MDIQDRKKAHSELLVKLHTLYDDVRGNKNEFIYDGPSDWNLYYNSIPRILFILKESPSGHHPSEKGHQVDTKFMRNLARWKIAIKESLEGSPILYKEINELPQFIDDVAMIEIKKIDEGKAISNNSELKQYATNDKEFLREQIELINPHIIICCGGSQGILDCYDIIYKDFILFEEKLINGVWLSNNRIVIDFYHPSTNPSYIENDSITDIEHFKVLREMLTSAKVNTALKKIIIKI